MTGARGGATRAVRRLIAVLVAAMQLVIALAPIAEGRAGASSVTHVEQQGIRLHYAHDDAECAACAVRHLGATPREAIALAIVLPARLEAPVARALAAPMRLGDPQARTRAPPMVS